MNDSRCISVRNQKENDFYPQTIYPSAVLIDDIDGDKKNELVLGTTTGEIRIYKGSLVQASLTYSGSCPKLQAITCLAYDHVTDNKIKYLLVHDSLGRFYMFTVPQMPARKRFASEHPLHHNNLTQSEKRECKIELKIVYERQLMINPRQILIDDFYNNGSRRMIMAYTDRILRVYGWQNYYSNSMVQTSASQANLQQGEMDGFKVSLQETGQFVLEHSFEMTDLIHSIQMVRDADNIKHLLITQPGYRVFQLFEGIKLAKTANSLLNAATTASNSSSTTSLNDSTAGSKAKQSVVSLGQSTLPYKLTKFYDEEVLNFQSSLSDKQQLPLERATFILSNVCYDKSDQYGFMLTLNGDVLFYKHDIALGSRKNESESSVSTSQVLWHRQINGAVLSYFKYDINRDGDDELIIATPEGQVYVMSCKGDYICLDLGEPVKLLHMGYLSLDKSRNEGPMTESETAAAAFEQAIKDICNTSGADSNQLSLVYISALSNRICLVTLDHILNTYKLIRVNSDKSSVSIKFKCENVLTHKDKLNLTDQSSQALANILYNL